MPGLPESISTATITSHAMPRLNRKPVNMYGREAGSSTFQNVARRLSFKTLATFRKSCGIARTPTAVLSAVGQSEQIAIVRVHCHAVASTDGFDFLTDNMITPASGYHASGETGRRIWKIGS